jgi:hypothetical protein
MSSHENVFLTGGAGSGKSTLLSHYLRESKVTYPVLASTGAAAVLVGGRTFHSFFGLGIMEGGPTAAVDKALKNRRVVSRLRKANGIVIDEISMIPGVALAAAEKIAREARGKKQIPWGGLRIIAVGDFGQLPPVTRPGQRRDWAFLDRVWQTTGFVPAVLDEIVRTTDSDFLDVLNSVRHGVVNEGVRDFLENRTREVPDDFDGTRLYSRRDATERENLANLEKIPGKAVAFETVYSGESKYRDTIRNNAPVPETIALKEGALVMLRQNDPQERWVNGTLGHVRNIGKGTLDIQLLKNGKFVEIEPYTFDHLDAEGEKVASATNFPVTLAYATTIHKAQGMTLDKMSVDLRALWEPGHAYVALSRVRTARELYIEGWSPKSIIVDPEVSRFHSGLREHTSRSS